MRKIYDVMKANTATEINSLKLDLLSNEVIETTNKETETTTKAIRVDVEIAKGQGVFSRCQFTVKIPESTKLKVTNAELEQADYEVFFTDLEISYIDAKGNVYFRASGYEVEKGE